MITYITTPIYYVNAQPHLGHAYTTIVADVYNRFCALRGDQVRFQTGTDEHGDKIVDAAAKEQVAPHHYVDRVSEMFRQTWPLLHIDYDRFIRTTDADHIAVVQSILQKVYDGGDIYFDEYTGLYCTGCERFLIERELVDGKCPDHQVTPKEITEQNYFFRMSKYQQRLIDHINEHPEFITPERYRNEVLSFLSEPLEDLCISRPTSRLDWGIVLPFDNAFVTYVWFDALINYLSGIGYPDGADYEKFWSGAEHLIAKDILKPHAIYWPTMLMAAGVPLYRKLHVHGYWNVDETKMSKSIGNVIRPAELVQEYGIDTLRYFLLREMSFGLDASFSSEAIVARKNADLANDLGNLFSRSVSMIEKYCGAVVPEAHEESETDRELKDAVALMVSEYQAMMGDFQFHRGLKAVWDLISLANRYIVQNEPWTLVKDPLLQPRLHTVLYNLAECLRIICLVLKPVMPESAAKMQHGLGFSADSQAMKTLADGAVWGGMKAGAKLNVIENLFPRVDVKKKQAAAADNTKKQPDDRPLKGKDRPEVVEGVISYEQFHNVKLVVARVIAAERVAKSERLMKLHVKAPDERTIVAGIAQFYKPSDLENKNVIIVANMKPA
ncbi:MAG: methionine--tRNA ligase, partial [Desulfocapsaceae bacterium]|nr:methionine--tRNA ligase [Desulfocapsaceae bacterium]